MQWSDVVSYQGRKVNRGTKAILDVANIILKSKRYGGETSPVTVVQGGYNKGGVVQSAGTHDGGAAFDTSAFNIKNRERLFRILGVGYYDRLAIRGVWARHGHGIVDGDGTASRGAKAQIVSYHKRRNALANNGPDTGYKMLVFPLFVAPWKANGKPGVFYLKKNQRAYEQPTTKSKVLRSLNKGQKFTVIARLRVGKTYWGINQNGLLVQMSSLVSKRPKTK